MKRHLKSSGWSKEKRQAASMRCKANKPWKNSTGPKTDAGKTNSSMNAETHGGFGKDMMALREALRAQDLFLKNFMDMHDLQDYKW